MAADPGATKKQPKKNGYILNGNYIGDKGPVFGARHVQVLLLAGCIVVGLATRASFAVQIVAMTEDSSSSPNPNIPTYDWTNGSIILSSFFWTYVLTNIIAAPLEKKYGPKWFLLGAIFMNCVAYMLIPLLADIFGSYGVLACRMIQGLGQGFMFPSQQTILGLWAPAEERSTASIMANTGNTLGSMFSSIIPGALSATWWGWPSSFYTIGVIGLLWCTLYLIFGHNSPATHPRITNEEKNYIQLSLNQHHDVKVEIPFKQIATSIHFWAVLVGQIGVAWSNNMATTEYSSYLDKVMNFDIQSNGIYSAIPSGLALLAGFIFGPLSDYIIKNGYLSRVNSRRVFHMSGGVGIAFSVLYLSFLQETQKTLSIFLMGIYYVSQAAMVCGNAINMLDLSPKFAGIIFGVSNATGQSIALFAPLMVQFIVTDQTNIAQWRTVFILTGCILLSTSMFFVIFASGERQLWDGPEKTVQLGEKQKRISVISIGGTIAVIPNSVQIDGT